MCIRDSVPLIASGGAGTMEHFLEAFRDADVDGALAASVFPVSYTHLDVYKRQARGDAHGQQRNPVLGDHGKTESAGRQLHSGAAD